jgi:hypothetical protein
MNKKNLSKYTNTELIENRLINKVPTITNEVFFREQDKETLFYFSLSSKEELKFIYDNDDTLLMFIIINPNSVNTDDYTFIKNMLDGCIFINKLYKSDLISFFQTNNLDAHPLIADILSDLEKLKPLIGKGDEIDTITYNTDTIYDYFKDILIIEKNSNSQELIKDLKNDYLLIKEEEKKEENVFFEFPDSFDILNDGVISNNIHFNYIFNNSIFINTNKFNIQKIQTNIIKLYSAYPQCKEILKQFIHIKQTPRSNDLSNAIRDIFNRKSVFFWF